MTLPALGKLTGAERELLDAARSGLAYVTDAPLRAAVLRELLLGLRGPVDPRGVRVEGARIAGPLNLDHVEAPVGLALAGCVVVNPISARAATLPWLDLSGGRIAGFDGTGLRIGHDLDLTGVRATGSGEYGAICLRDARITGRTLLSDAEVTNEDGPAVYLDGLESGSLRGVDLRATGAGPLGAVRAIGAHITRDADFDGAELTNGSGPALMAGGLVVDDELRLAETKLTGAGADGVAVLLGARIGGEVALDEAVLTNDSGPGLEADRLRAGDLRCTGVTVTAAGGDAAVSLLGARIGGQVDFGGAVLATTEGRGLSADGMRVEDSFSAEGLKARASGEYGALCLLGAHVGGTCYFEGMELANDSGAALSGDRLRVGGNVHFHGLTATGAGEPGTIRLLTARIDGDLYLEGARLANDAGPALHADRLEIGGSFDLAGAHITGAGEEGALRLRDAGIAGQLRLPGAELVNASGPALGADDLRVGPYLDLAGVKVTCSSGFGALSLRSARIGGSAVLADAEVVNDAGPVLVADRCEIRDSLSLTGLRGTGAGEDPAIHLLGAHIGGQLAFSGVKLGMRDEDGTLVSLEDAVVDGTVFPPAGFAGLVELDGFRFGSLGHVTWREWLTLIRSHTAAYRPGPYQQLAASERAAGHDGNARQILIAQQRDLHRRAPQAIGGWPARRFHWLWGALAGYGYRARRTAAALLLAVVAAGGLGLWAGHVGDGGHRAAERTADLTAATGTPCTAVELVGVGLDRGLPLSPGVRGRCDLNTGIAAGQWFTVAIWLVQAAIWALATLALVGYTGLVRKTG